MPALRFVPAVALIALLAGPLAAGAQTPPPPGPASSPAPATTRHHHHRHHDAFSRALRGVNLTPAQQQQIAGFRDQTKKANVNADPATRKANETKLHDQIMGVLTPDQKAQVSAQMQAAPHLRYPEGQAQPGPTATPNVH
jgi:Spy/CpxP family protein refolding chaperone